MPAIKLLFPLVLLLASPGIRCVIGPDDCVSPRNEIIRENCRPGNDSREWDVNADGDPSIQVINIFLRNMVTLHPFVRASRTLSV